MCIHRTTEHQNTWVKTDRTTVLEINESTFLIGDFNTSLLEMDRFSRSMSKDIGKLYSTINQLHIIDIYRLFHPTITQNTFFLSSHGTRQTTLWTIKHTLTNARDWKPYNICLRQQWIWIRNQYRRIAGKFQNTCRLKLLFFLSQSTSTLWGEYLRLCSFPLVVLVFFEDSSQNRLLLLWLPYINS